MEKEAVKEKDAGNSVAGFVLLFIAIEAEEVGGAHVHGTLVLGAGKQRRWVDVRDRVAAKVILAGDVVRESVYPGVESVLPC